MNALKTLSVMIVLGIAAGAAIAGQSGEPQYYVEGMRCVDGKYGMQLPKTLPELLAIAPILKEEVQVTEKWEGYTTTRKTVYFSGLELGLVTFSNDLNRYFLSSAKIRSNKWADLSPFHVGDSIHSIRSKLDDIGEDDDHLRSTYTGENENVRFETKAGKVSAILYECYAD